MLTVFQSTSTSKKKKRRLKLTALGLILLGLWGMLALLLGVSVGRETRYRADLKADLEPGFGETHATPHLLGEPVENLASAEEPVPKYLPPICAGLDCPDMAEVGSEADTADIDSPVDDGADDATSSLGRPHGPEGPPPSLNIARGGTADPFPNFLFIPGGPSGGDPIPGGTENPNGGPDNFNPPENPKPPENPGDTPPPDFTQPVLAQPEGPPKGGPEGLDDPTGPTGPHGPEGPKPDQPLQIPEPITLSLFATGVAGSVLLRRRKSQLTK